MSKYRELPAKPRNVHAVQYTGVDKGVPTWNEPAPAWILAAFAKGHLQVIDGGLHCRGKSLDLGSWLLVDEDLNVDGIWSVMAISFIQKYTVARKKAVRKPNPARLVA